MSFNIILVPLGLGDIVAESGTISSWGFDKKTLEEYRSRNVSVNIDTIREFLDEVSRKYLSTGNKI